MAQKSSMIDTIQYHTGLLNQHWDDHLIVSVPVKLPYMIDRQQSTSKHKTHLPIVRPGVCVTTDISPVLEIVVDHCSDWGAGHIAKYRHGVKAILLGV